MALAAPAVAQDRWDVRAYLGLGVATASVPDLVDYATLLGRPQPRLNEFQTFFELGAGLDVFVVEGWTAGIDLVRSTRTIAPEATGVPSGWEFESVVTVPALVARRVIDAGGVQFLVGGGGGVAFGALTQRYAPFASVDDYRGRGFALVAQAQGSTPLGSGLSGLIALDARYIALGGLKNGAGRAPAFAGHTATLDMFALALRFSVAYRR